MILLNNFLFSLRTCKCNKFLRFYSQSVSKVHLSKLRKLTGLPFSVCKEALLKNDDDFEGSKQWLEEESVRRGWDKAHKLSGRLMSCGLLGLMSQKSKLLVVEANCETDFVARNSAFKNFLAAATETIMDNCTFDYRNCWNSDELNQLKAVDSQTLKDKLLLTIGAIGENIQLRRAVGFSIIDPDLNQHLAFYTHTSMDIKQSIRNVYFAKYAALIRYSSTVEEDDKWIENSRLFGKQICQHIVGMNPNPSLHPPENRASDPNEEKFIMWQPFLMDEAVQLGELLDKNNMVLEDFVRIECGQSDEVHQVKDIQELKSCS